MGVIAQYKASTTVSERACIKNTMKKNNSIQGTYNRLRARMYERYNRGEQSNTRLTLLS